MAEKEFIIFSGKSQVIPFKGSHINLTAHMPFTTRDLELARHVNKFPFVSVKVRSLEKRKGA